MGLATYREPDSIEDSGDSLLLRAAIRLEAWARPVHGWGAPAVLVAVSLLPALALRANQWLNLGSQQATLDWSGPLAVVVVWWVWGWRSEARRPRGFGRGVSVVLIGLLVVSQLVLRWIPGPMLVVSAIQTGDWMMLLTRPADVWLSFASRVVLWWQGVQSGGAAQDNLVFAALGATVIWWVTSLSAWLARRTQQGIAAAAPVLWLLGLILLYSSTGKMLLVTGLALAILLQVVMDQARMAARWQRLRLDYSPGVFLDRIFAVASALALILTVAATMPNLYWEPLVMRYYGLISPFTSRAESLSDRLFPDARGASRLRGGVAGGLPNDFLLQGGVAPGDTVVMRVRTDETPTYEFPFDEMAPPIGHYVRSSTFTVYDGLGWSNPRDTERRELEADTRFWDTTAGAEWTGASEPAWGRRPLVQSVIMEVNSQVLFAAAEPVEFSVPARLELLPSIAGVDGVSPVVDDLVAAFGRERSYTVISSIPAVDERTLRMLAPIPASPAVNDRLARYLALPDTITERTIVLAAEIVAEAPTPYDRALAIESYLRQFAYDLTVPEPPAQVTDVADFFLFDLQRGYCDYYATAFVVLARLSGLPTRFATGYAMGSWDPREGIWVVTEGEAHSWPEVFFSDVGWVAFEPTAGRPTLARVGSPSFSASAPLPPAPPPVVTGEDGSHLEADWQVWFWLIPVALLVWAAARGVQSVLARREDPWLAVLRWGAKAGRPMGPGETVLEYGDTLADMVLAQPGASPGAHRSGETIRVVARELRGMSRVINRYAYGPPDRRVAERDAIREQWRRTGGYLRGLNVRGSKQ